MRLRRVLRELPATLAALAVTVVVELGLRTVRLPRLASALGTPLALEQDASPAESGPAVARLPERAARQVRATQRVLRRWPFGDTCLRQALVSGQRLRRLQPRLHLGVAKIDGEVRAHAWLVVRGRILDTRAAASSYQDLAQPARGWSA